MMAEAGELAVQRVKRGLTGLSQQRPPTTELQEERMTTWPAPLRGSSLEPWTWV